MAEAGFDIEVIDLARVGLPLLDEPHHPDVLRPDQVMGEAAHDLLAELRLLAEALAPLRRSAGRAMALMPVG